MILGSSIARPTKEDLAISIAGHLQLKRPSVSGGSSVYSEFLDAIHDALTGTPAPGSDAYRRTEAVMEALGLPYDPYWDTSEAAPSGGSTVTTRAYSQIHAALSATPRCFVLRVPESFHEGNDGELTSRTYHYAPGMKSTLALNDAGPGSLTLHLYSSGSVPGGTAFVSSGSIAYISPGWSGPWQASIRNYSRFRSAIPLSAVKIQGLNPRHEITEVSMDTYRAIIDAGAPLIAPVTGDFRTSLETIADRVQKAFPVRDLGPLEIEMPDTLPSGNYETPIIPVAEYTLDSEGVPRRHGQLASRAKHSAPATNKIVEQRAVEFAVDALSRKGWIATADRQLDGVGYDLEFARGSEIRHVEVKGIQGSNVAFNLTPKEFWRARTDPNWIVVAVTSVLSPNRAKTHVITRDRVVGASLAATGYRATL